MPEDPCAVSHGPHTVTHKSTHQQDIQTGHFLPYLFSTSSLCPDMTLSCRVNLFSNSRLSSEPFLFDFLTNTLSSDTRWLCVECIVFIAIPICHCVFMSAHCLFLCVADSWSEPVVSFCVLHVSHCGVGVWERELDAGKQFRDELTWTLVSLIVPTSEVLCVLGCFSHFLFTWLVHIFSFILQDCIFSERHDAPEGLAAPSSVTAVVLKGVIQMWL